MKDLAERAVNGDDRAVARLITHAENCHPDLYEAMRIIHRHGGRAQVIGITGVMGAGKSTLIAEIALEYRKRGKTVGIIAIDPTSPFTGGALLGDRIRMSRLTMDPGIFIRSMGTRGMLGGLTGAVYDVMEIMDASGKDVIIVETVGVGQAEVDIIKIADTTLVVLVPGLGDSIQTIKAGLMEIADIFVVNKADVPGIERTMAEIESMIDLGHRPGVRKTPVLATAAKECKGITELVDAIEEHREFIVGSGSLPDRRRKRYEAELVEIIRKRLMTMIFDEKVFREKVESLIGRIEGKETDPYSAAEEILDGLLK
ncbi:MAG: methylmalonyl Co-A mutase-associated GTPase MeaB [Candidatus Thermoplasmatota archaeon]|nr:methylmalonyl Co-A mutase-associated GTPase MeaB [Candidatus Thermoplasmatota archaeon]